MVAGNGRSASGAGEGAEQFAQETDEQTYSGVESSDSENDEVPEACEPVVARSGKRVYGVLSEDLIEEQRLEEAKLADYVKLLRSILPGNYDEGEKTDREVLSDAYLYTMNLKYSVDRLEAELGPSSALGNFEAGNLNEGLPQEPPTTQSKSSDSICGLNQLPVVEVKREKGKIELHIACMNRPGLIVDITRALDSKRVTVLDGTISLREDVLFEDLILEKETLVLHSGPELLPVEAEDEALRDIIFRAIRQETIAAGSH